MRLVLLINFISELLNLSEEELKKLHHHLEGLLKLDSREEVINIMDENFEEEIILSEANEQEESQEDENLAEQQPQINEENNDTLETEISPKLNDAIVEKDNQSANLEVIDQLKGIKSELKEFKEELIKQNGLNEKSLEKESEKLKNLIKGGDQMANEKQQCQCEMDGTGFCPEVIQEAQLPENQGEVVLEISCVKVLHENFFDNYEIDEESLAENFTIDKLRCCKEKVLVESQATGCLYPSLLAVACGCVEYGVYVTADPKTTSTQQADIEPPIICCENCICIDEVIDFACFNLNTDLQCGGGNNNVFCPGVDVAVEWTDVKILQGVEKRLINPEGCITEDINFANKAAVVFEGTLTLTPSSPPA